MGYEQLPPEVPVWRQEFNACKNCERLEARIRVLEDALPPPERLELLALVFDAYDALSGSKGKEVQNDLRLWATRIRVALEVKP
jgi:hypothetical protein